ncbi:MAG: hypothetical protein GY841_03075, partial [FCB group bacterium]|nr:hypothetical protein [FCB group bacterium]
MQVKILVLSCLVLLLASVLQAEQVNVGRTSKEVIVDLEESSINRTVIRFEIGAFARNEIEINGEMYSTLSFSDEGKSSVLGEPQLPRICRSIIIPDNAKMKANIVTADYIDFKDIGIVPSKGCLLLSDNPDTIPYTFGSVYEMTNWYPKEIVHLRKPFILRDHRGTVIEFNAMRYNPGERVLRVYTSVTVEIVSDEPGEKNVFNRKRITSGLIPDYNQTYQDLFINYGSSSTRYTQIGETGDLLIITYDDFLDNMLPLVEWKKQKGIKTTIVEVSSIGNNSSSIKSFIQDFYDSTDLAWILLVGDSAELAPAFEEPGHPGVPADPWYGMLAGDDHYPDAMVGRFSATDTFHVNTQVRRTIDYEKSPQGTDWFSKGLIFHAESPDDSDSMMTWCSDIRDSLLSFTYTQVDTLVSKDDHEYEMQVASDFLNEGGSFLMHIGHGSMSYWAEPRYQYFNVSDSLENTDMLPFILDYGCKTGQFDDWLCFAEIWLRATDDSGSTGNPVGAIAMLAKSRSTGSGGPYLMTEAINLLVNGDMTTFGGMCFNGMCSELERDTSNPEVAYVSHIFGDPSVQLRTDTPDTLVVQHGDSIDCDYTEFPVIVADVDSAVCAIYADSVLFGSAYSNADDTVYIPLTGDFPAGVDFTLTVTAFNYLPYIDSTIVGFLDADGDGIGNACDSCTDIDGDGYGDPGFPFNTCDLDNCPNNYNVDQANADLDSYGDICDSCTDLDGDGYGDPGYDSSFCDIDNCPGIYNPFQENSDLDSLGDSCDNCPSETNIDQLNTDSINYFDTLLSDAYGDPCDSCTDTDGDGYGNPTFDANTCDEDNCPQVFDSTQADSNFDGVGDVCDKYLCGDANGDGSLNVGDAVFLINYVFK